MDAIDYAWDEIQRKEQTDREFQELWLWYEHEHAPQQAGDYCRHCLVGTLEQVGANLACNYCGLEAD